tara:strand:- start:1087 stop:1809 length:723 start_codon:yes stop_codon:yes gene_type:complete
MNLLKLSKGNAKLSNDTLILSISAGITCPGSNNCKAWVTVKNDKRVLNRGPESMFTCFAASEELRYPNVFKSRRYNYNLINSYVVKKDINGLTNLINESIQAKKKNIKKFRIHESGDFFNIIYLKAFINVARLNKDIKFYCYSKSLDLFMTVFLPDNFYMVASYGGKFDYLINQGYFTKYSKVVFSEEEAKKLNLKIDKDDSLCFGNKPFGLLLHGLQEKGSEAGEALKLIKRKKKLAIA